jgi:septal ring factor EnvC (AmiA/AmiB activator)
MESGGREQNYWPGFVDALSNVVLTLVFVLVVFVFALMIASNKVAKKMDEVVQARMAEKATQAQGSQKVEELQAKLQQLQEQLDRAQEQLKEANQRASVVNTEQKPTDIKVEQKEAQKTATAPVKISGGSTALNITYPLSVAEMDDKSAAELSKVLDQAVKRNGTKAKVVLRSYVGKEPYTAASRLAYYRAISIRNKLISEGIPAANIASTIVRSTKPEEGHVEVVFQK